MKTITERPDYDITATDDRCAECGVTSHVLRQRRREDGTTVCWFCEQGPG